LASSAAAHWNDGGDPQSSPSIHLDRITLPKLATEKSGTGLQRKPSVTKVRLLAIPIA
jgi:hypothetical protein